jgi:2'-5' RNA ligase
MRLFVALDTTTAVRESIAQFCAKVRPSLPDARWVRPEAIHVTLKFIGEMAEDRVVLIRKALASVRSAAPVEMEFRGVGFFPDARRPRVFWAGIIASPNLAEIAREIETRLEPLGIAREKREFRPHLTLARIENAKGIEKLQAMLGEAGEPQFGKVSTREMHLMRTELGIGGARYTKIESYDFTAAR